MEERADRRSGEQSDKVTTLPATLNDYSAVGILQRPLPKHAIRARDSPTMTKRHSLGNTIESSTHDDPKTKLLLSQNPLICTLSKSQVPQECKRLPEYSYDTRVLKCLCGLTIRRHSSGSETLVMDHMRKEILIERGTNWPLHGRPAVQRWDCPTFMIFRRGAWRDLAV